METIQSLKNRIRLPKLTGFEWVLFFFIFIAYAFFFNEYPGWNGKTRMNLIYAIVDQGRMTIDSYWDKPGYDTLDVAFYKGHYYSDKSPVLSYLGVPVYWAWRQITGLLGIYVKPLDARYFIILLVISFPSAILSLLLFRILGLIRKDPVRQLILVILFAFGTIVFPYSLLFLAHQPASVFMFAGFYILFMTKLRFTDSPIPRYLVFISGILVGFGFATEPPTGIILIGLTGYLWIQLKEKKQIGWFFSGIFIPLLMPFSYNLVCFDNPFHSGYRYELLDNFRIGMSKGLMGITYPKWDAVWGITFSSYRGLFYYCPILILAIPGFYFFLKNKQFNKEAILALFIVLAFFYFNFSYYEWSGGWGTGPRHIIPMLPFMMMAIYFLPSRWKYLFIITGFLSLLILFVLTLTEPQAPQDIPFPLKQFTLPRIKAALNEYHMPGVYRGVLEQNIISILFGIKRIYAVNLWILYWVTGTVGLYFYARRKSFS